MYTPGSERFEPQPHQETCTLISLRWANLLAAFEACPLKRLTLSLPRMINVKFPLQPHQKYYITHSMKNLAFHNFLRWTMIILSNSHYLTSTFLSKRLGECTFWAREKHQPNWSSSSVKSWNFFSRPQTQPDFFVCQVRTLSLALDGQLPVQKHTPQPMYLSPTLPTQ